MAEVDRIMSKLKKFNYEYIFVDDGSNDNTWQEIVKVSDKNKHIKGIRFTTKF